MATSGEENTVNVDTDKTNQSTDVLPGPIALGFGDSFTMDTTTENNYNNGAKESGSSLSCYSQDVKDPHAVRGKCGLYNLGNTCFMNSGLQCLMGTIPLVRFLLKFEGPNKAEKDTLLGQFNHLFCKMWGGHFSLVYPRDFKHILGLFYPQFQDYRQHDCQEFLALLLDTLHEQLNFKRLNLTSNRLEAGAEPDLLPSEAEPSMNNMSATSLTPDGKKENKNVDQSHSIAAHHSGLTFDNMKFAQEGFSVSDLDESVLPMHDTKGSQKNKNQSSLGKMTNLILDDTDQANVSEHSSDSEQCSVIQNLRLRSSPVTSQSENVLNRGCPALLSSGSCVNSSSAFDTVSSDDHIKDSLLDKTDVKTETVIPDDQEEELDNVDVTGHTEGIPDPGDAVRLEELEEPVVLNNAVERPASGVPSLDDLYAKETKTLNTNVLASDYLHDTVTTDSEKFVKQENYHRPDVLEEVDRLSSLNNVLEAAGKKDEEEGEGSRRIKDVNIRADKKSRCSTGACGSSSFLEPEQEDYFTLSHIKRMKFEGTEKNLQMQEMSKINKTRILFGDVRHQSEVESESDAEEMDADMDVSEDEESSVSEVAVPVSIETNSYSTADLIAAEESWKAYLSKNDSVIVSTFQGQFKSTVICSECNHVSVTFEPFMYLSVPIPHAMERQFCVTFVPVRSEPVRYLIVMNKLEKVTSLKAELCRLAGKTDCDIILTEVLDWHISRILEDNTMLRYVNDSTRKLYAFEMEACTVETEATATSTSAEKGTTLDQNPSGSYGTGMVDNNPDIFSKMEPFTLASIPQHSDSMAGQTSPETQKPEPDVFGSFVNQSETSASPVNQSDGMADYKNYDLAGTGMWEWSGDTGSSGNTANSSHNVWKTADSGSVSLTEGNAGIEDSKGKDDGSQPTDSEEWRSCAICLEELTDNELMVHTSCGGTFCPSCLEMSVQHYGDSSYCCPVCSSPASMTEDFVPLANAANHKPKTRIVTIPMTFRCETDSTGSTPPTLFTHPNILHLPSNLTGEYVYKRVSDLFGINTSYKIVLTDGQGLHCARCLYMEHCSGCEITRDGEVTLRPADHLTVHVNCISDVEIEAAQRCHDDKSMERQRLEEPVTLYDCLQAFTQSEDLDEHWYCPQCERNQRAKKTMTVWQYPDTIIIHLKRFMFHELSSTKVDSKVVFPIDSLDLSGFISGPHTKLLQYSLSSLVCHFGGVNSGHYTSYAKHAVDGKWYYYNDETVSLQSPGDDDFSSTYVLFYQRKGTDMAIQIPDDLELHDLDSDHHVTDHVLPGPVLLTAPPEGEELILKKPVESSYSGESQCVEADSTLDFYT